jgi:hypothetical protein
MSASRDGAARDVARHPCYSAAMRISTIVLGFVLLSACSRPPSKQPTTSPDPAGEERPGLTAGACEAKGGKVIGDIGDGAIHRPDYRCPDSGEAPIGSIVADPDGPMAVEGSVCCK